jgi:hypothetical protein
MSSPDNLQRTVLPIPDQPRTGLICYDAKDPENKYPTITPLRPPAGAPNVLLVLIDDAGFGSRDSQTCPSTRSFVAGTARPRRINGLRYAMHGGAGTACGCALRWRASLFL